jgi:hypothetical protein
MVMFALHQIRTRQSQANPRVLLRFGALYDGYKPNAYAFELMHLLRQGLLLRPFRLPELSPATWAMLWMISIG